MKNILNYYYHMIVDDIDNNGYFSYNNHFFCLYLYNRNIDEVESLVYLNSYMLNNNLAINKIINNVDNSPLTYHDGKYYALILIKYQNPSNYRTVLAPNNRIFDILKRNNWDYLWSKKIDYIEYQMNHLDNKYPIINNSINYYIGLAENAITYFKIINKNNVNLYINHRRQHKNSLYNPFELVIDYKVRDIVEYVKEAFFNHNKSINEIKSYLQRLSLNEVDYLLLYSRMLFPSYYFDVYEKIVNNNLEEEKLSIIIDKIPLYEELLYEIYLMMRRNSVLGVEWINKKF